MAEITPQAVPLEDAKEAQQSDFSSIRILDKKDLVRTYYADVKMRSIHHNRQFLRLKKISSRIDIVSTVFSAIAVSSLIVNLSFEGNVAAAIAGTIFSSISGIMSTTKMVSNINEKMDDHRMVSKQYRDLERYIAVVLSRNHLSSEDIIVLLDDISGKIALIGDNEVYSGPEGV